MGQSPAFGVFGLIRRPRSGGMGTMPGEGLAQPTMRLENASRTLASHSTHSPVSGRVSSATHSRFGPVMSTAAEVALHAVQVVLTHDPLDALARAANSLAA